MGRHRLLESARHRPSMAKLALMCQNWRKKLVPEMWRHLSEVAAHVATVVMRTRLYDLLLSRCLGHNTPKDHSNSSRHAHTYTQICNMHVMRVLCMRKSGRRHWAEKSDETWPRSMRPRLATMCARLGAAAHRKQTQTCLPYCNCCRKAKRGVAAKCLMRN